jgi:hypothetical protein
LPAVARRPLRPIDPSDASGPLRADYDGNDALRLVDTSRGIALWQRRFPVEEVFQIAPVKIPDSDGTHPDLSNFFLWWDSTHRVLLATVVYWPLESCDPLVVRHHVFRL